MQRRCELTMEQAYNNIKTRIKWLITVANRYELISFKYELMSNQLIIQCAGDVMVIERLVRQVLILVEFAPFIFAQIHLKKV